MDGRHHIAFGTGCLAVASATSGVLPTPAVIAGVLVGSLAPDLDAPNSTLSKALHFSLPGKHRTWTHTAWVLMALVLIAHQVEGMPILHDLVSGFSTGYLTHLVADSVSRAGICWFWPLKDYIRYDSGAFVAPGHVVKLYRTQTGQTVICVLTWLLAALIFFGRASGRA